MSFTIYLLDGTQIKKSADKMFIRDDEFVTFLNRKEVAAVFSLKQIRGFVFNAVVL